MNGDACAFAHDPFLVMPDEYVQQQTLNYQRAPELIRQADPEIIMANAIAQRRPMDSAWFLPEATTEVYPRQLIRKYNQQHYDTRVDPTVPTIARHGFVP